MADVGKTRTRYPGQQAKLVGHLSVITSTIVCPQFSRLQQRQVERFYVGCKRRTVVLPSTSTVCQFGQTMRLTGYQSSVLAWPKAVACNTGGQFDMCNSW